MATSTSKRIVYMDDSGLAVIIVPTDVLSIEEIAKKDVPAGKKYKIVDKTDIPTDRSFRNAWEVDESDLTDGVGVGQDQWYEDNPSYKRT